VTKTGAAGRRDHHKPVISQKFETAS